MARLSFIVTAFNRPRLLDCALASIACQTFSDWEVVVMDNSVNLTHAAINEDDAADLYSCRYYNVSKYTRIEGAIHAHSLYKATKIGVSLTTGDWLCFPNDDSYYCPWFAERMLAAADANNWQLVYCDVVMGGPGGHYLLSAKPERCNIDKTSFILRRDCFPGFTYGHGDTYPMADGMMIEDLVRGGIRHGRVPEILCVHN